jgi:hypothetical protein
MQKHFNAGSPCRWLIRFAVITFCSILQCSVALAQDYLGKVGFPAFSTNQPVQDGVINVANGNLHIEIQVGNFPQRRLPGLSEKFVYDSRSWKIINTGTSEYWSSSGGWSYSNGYAQARANYTQTNVPCGAGSYTVYSDYTWQDEHGTIRYFPVSTAQDNGSGCQLPYPTSATGYANDSSGYQVSASGMSAVVYYPDGTQFTPAGEADVSTTTDANGNQVVWNLEFDPVDSLGRTPVKNPWINDPTHYYVLNSQGSTDTFTLLTGNVNVSTNFGQAGVTEYSGTVNTYQSIALPDPQ